MNLSPQHNQFGIETLLTPVQTSNTKAIAERLVGTLRLECLDHFIIINERHLRLVLQEYAAHYKRRRPHRSLDLAPPNGPPVPIAAPSRGRVKTHPVLGGLHHEYEWEAA
jgi:putative transposase